MGLADWLNPEGDTYQGPPPTNAFIAPPTKRAAGKDWDSLASVYGKRPTPFAKTADLGAASTAESASVTAPGVSSAADDEIRARQMAMMAHLKAQASGTGPSAAGLQIAQGLNTTKMQQASAAASLAGRGNAGASLRNYGQNMASATMAANQSAANAKIQEAMAAQQQLAGLAGTARESDLSMASLRAGLGQQAALATSGYAQQSGLANQAAANEFARIRAGMSQQTGLANQEAWMSGQALNDKQIAELAALYESKYSTDRDLEIGRWRAKTERDTKKMLMDWKSYNDARNKELAAYGAAGEGAIKLGQYAAKDDSSPSAGSGYSGSNTRG